MARSRRHRRSRKMRGGSYSSATTYGQYVNGSGDSQWDRTMDQGGAYGGVQSNVIIGAQGQNSQLVGVPTASQLQLAQGGGGRRRRKGGFLGGVINQALVPVALLGMQQTFGRKRRGGRRTRRHRR